MRLAPGLTFSWKRAVGLSGIRCRIAHLTGLPTTANGWQRKVGRTVIRWIIHTVL